MKTYIWIIQPIGEITMVAVVANNVGQARAIAVNHVDGDEDIDPAWAKSYFEEINKEPYKVIEAFECITFGNWNI